MINCCVSKQIATHGWPYYQDDYGHHGILAGAMEFISALLQNTPHPQERDHCMVSSLGGDWGANEAIPELRK